MKKILRTGKDVKGRRAIEKLQRESLPAKFLEEVSLMRAFC
jgi:hypothetical protein